MKPTQQEIIDVARAVEIVPGIGNVVNGKYRPHKNALGKSVPVEWLQEFAKLLLERFGAGGGEPLFWYRPRSDGLYEGPIHNAAIERVRKESGGWIPLYTHPSPTDLQDEYLRGLEDAAKKIERWETDEEYVQILADHVRALKDKQ